MPKYKHISFYPQRIGHDFSFLDSEQFPADIRIVRVDYNPNPLCGLRLILESDSYDDRPFDEVLQSPGINLTQHVRTKPLAEGGAVQFASYNPIPPERLKVPDGMVLYANLNNFRQVK